MIIILAVLSATDYFQRDNTDQKVSVVFINKEITSGNFLIAPHTKHSLTLHAIDTQSQAHALYKKPFCFSFPYLSH
jgi:hypothetical protein